MPIAEGGFGLPNFSLTAPVAFVSSCAAALSDILLRCPRLFVETQASPWITELSKATDYVQSFLNREDITSFSDYMQNPATLRQSSLTSTIHLVTSAKYHGLPRGDPVAAARLLSLRSSDAGAWLLARCSKENQMTDVQFRTAICIRLGATLPGLTEASKCSECKSHPLVDPRGEHFLHCPCGGDRIRRHNALRKEFHTLVHMAGFKAQAEPTQFVFTDGRHPDLLLFNPISVSNTGRDITFDFAVTHPSTTSALRRHSDQESGKAADILFKTKEAYYQDYAIQNNLDCYGIVFETFGYCHPVASSWIVKLATQAAKVHGYLPSVLVSYWRRRISVALQRANATMVLNCINAALGVRKTLLNEGCFNDNC